jgi:hypothetical protein
MAPSEEKALQKEISDFRSEFRVFVTKLMGDDEAENVEGRIPRLEAARRNHNRRILRLEALALMGLGGLALFKAIGWALDAGAHLVQLARVFK